MIYKVKRGNKKKKKGKAEQAEASMEEKVYNKKMEKKKIKTNEQKKMQKEKVKNRSFFFVCFLLHPPPPPLSPFCPVTFVGEWLHAQRGPPLPRLKKILWCLKKQHFSSLFFNFFFWVFCIKINTIFFFFENLHYPFSSLSFFSFPFSLSSHSYRYIHKNSFTNDVLIFDFCSKSH